MSDAQWYKALRPGTLAGGKFVKAGELFQLGEDDEFSDKWMEKHEAPAVTALKPADAKKEQEDAVRLHEETDRVRRGKFSTPSVPRSEEGQREHDRKRKAEAKRVKEQARQASLNPPAIDRGSKTPAAPAGIHETSVNPSRIDENARRKAP